MFSCSSTKKDNDKVNVFLLKWSQAMSTGKEMEVRRFYDAQFVVPKILFNLPGGIRYQFEVSNIQLSSSEKDETLYATVPFNLTSSDGVKNSGTIELHYNVSVVT